MASILSRSNMLWMGSKYSKNMPSACLFNNESKAQTFKHYKHRQPLLAEQPVGYFEKFWRNVNW